MKTRQLTNIFHALSYYLCWVFCVYLAGLNYLYLATVLAILLFIGQIYWQIFHNLPWKNAFYFAILLGIIGTLVDTFWLHIGLIYFNANILSPVISAPWMICIWYSFGFAVGVLYKNYVNNYYLWSLIMLFGLPWAYWLGSRFNALNVDNATRFYPVLGITWAIIFPCCLYFFNHVTMRTDQ